MTIQKALDPIELYYQEFPEERDMTESYLHRDITEYLRDLLKWYYRSQAYLITANLVVYDAKNRTSPDVAVIKDVKLTKAEQKALRGWEVSPPVRPAPLVVFEISSKDNWDKDIEPDKNRKRYAELGVQEYFAFDPMGYWGETIHLKGWRYQQGQALEIKPNEQGWLWSEQLALWVAEEDAELRLYNQDRQLVLTKAEEEYRRAEQAENRAEKAENRAEKAEGQIEKERADHEALLAKLRAKGIDPDKL